MNKVAVAYGFNEFDFDGQIIRTIEKEGQTLWVLGDAARAIGIINSRDLAQRADKSDRMQVYDFSGVGVVHGNKNNDLERRPTQVIDIQGVDGVHGNKNNKLERIENHKVFSKISYLDESDPSLLKANAINMINEHGLYSVLMRSNKPKAKEFQRWVIEKAIPSIRRGEITTKIDSMEAKPLTKVKIVRERVRTAIESSLPEGVTLATVRRSIAQMTEFASIFSDDPKDVAARIKLNLAQEFGLKFAALIGAAPPPNLIAADATNLPVKISANCMDAETITQTPPKTSRGKSGVKCEKPSGYLTPTELASRLGWRSAIEVNKRLESMGFQVKDYANKTYSSWVPTKTGLPYAKSYPVLRDGDVINASLSWHPSIVNQIKLTRTSDLFAGSYA